MNESSERVVYEFDGYFADPLSRRLSRGDEIMPLMPKAFDTLLFLIANRGEVVRKNTLIDAVWANTAVEENNLTQQIATLRRAFGERAGEHRFIVTQPGKGYRFVPRVRTLSTDEYENVAVVRSTKTNVTIDVTRDNARRMWPFHRPDGGRVLGSSLAIVYALVVCVGAFWPAMFGPSDSRSRQSVAVLSFRVDNSVDESLGAGIRDTLRARIGNLEDVELKPIFTHGRVDEAVIAGKQMHVDVILSGSVQRDEGRVRVAIEMLDVKNQRIVWGRTFDRNGSGIFELQDAIANEVVKAIKLPT